MEWIEALRGAIDFIETHLLEEISVEDVANEVYLSPFYFQKGFKLITGYSLGEYIRNRRLYLAALEIIKEEGRVIDLAYKYGYDTPESFTKAFVRFHGQSPIKLKKEPYHLKVFLPLQISLSIKGGERIDYYIEEMEAFEVIGLEKPFTYEGAFREIPLFWEAYNRQYCWQYAHELQSFEENIYGISIDEGMEGATFNYTIAIPYKKEYLCHLSLENKCDVEKNKQVERQQKIQVKMQEEMQKEIQEEMREEVQKEIQEGMPKISIRKIPALTWAKFKCIGPMPEALQALNNKIFKEWLPGNSTYEIAAGYNVELYSRGDIKSKDYLSEIWIPVKKKHAK